VRYFPFCFIEFLFFVSSVLYFWNVPAKGLEKVLFVFAIVLLFVAVIVVV